MLSVAAAAILTSTGAFAFETNTQHVILTSTTEGATIVDNYKPEATYDSTKEILNNFTAAVPADENLSLSTTHFGDALIYPAFRQGGEWESEIVVTNTSATEAVVAKVVLYAGSDSREYVDFNIYLSADDVFRFTIKDNKIVTSDDSIAKAVYSPASAETNRDVPVMNTLGEEMEVQFYDEGESLSSLEKGYVAIYGMTQSVDASDNNGTDDIDERYHSKHAELFTEYRAILDNCRTGWRDAFNGDDTDGIMINGMITSAIHAPDTNTTCGDDATSTLIEFQSPTNVLTGTVTIANSGADAREVTLHATALENFTQDTVNMMLWTEGEFASIADRRIVVDSNNTNTYASVTPIDGVTRGYYEETGVTDDNIAAFGFNEAYYAFKSDSDSVTTLKNSFLITQPYKRTLVQLGNDQLALGTQGFWTGISAETPYGYFCKDGVSVFNDGEIPHSDNPDSDQMITITSPYNSSTAPAICDEVRDELASMSDLEAGSDHEDTNGFARIDFGLVGGIVTQQIGTMVNGQAQTSWVYAPATR